MQIYFYLFFTTDIKRKKIGLPCFTNFAKMPKSKLAEQIWICSPPPSHLQHPQIQSATALNKLVYVFRFIS